MVFIGLRFDQPGALIGQSWGPDTPGGPLVMDQPSFSFWADRRTVEGMLAAGDSWALSKAPAFKARPLPARWTYGIAA